MENKLSLNGCVSKDYQEIDGQEFEVETLEKFIEVLKSNKQVHINYFDGCDDLDLWVDVK